MTDIITFSKVLDHENLSARLDGLQAHAKFACRHARTETASPVLVFRAAQLLSDIYRLISREPGARALQRIDPFRPPRNEILVTLLHDAGVALDLFEWNHREHDGEHGSNDWITVEDAGYQPEQTWDDLQEFDDNLLD
jgi:hypothetical protein